MLKNLKREFKENKLTQVFFVVIIVVLVFNTFNYYHELGYDGQHHKYNMEVLPLNLPTEEDTKEFFNPPLKKNTHSILLLKILFRFWTKKKLNHLIL